MRLVLLANCRSLGKRLKSSRMATNHLVTQVPTHAKRVLSLYKKSLRCLRDHFPEIPEYRYHAAFIRKMFDDTKDIKDFMEADRRCKIAESQLKTYMHAFPRKFYNLKNTWHPMEKAQYPEYFAKREIRKREFLESWEKKYRDPEGSTS
ncbi:hypothetical protein KUTeg_019849 [Tegillarca granosa]|uniref:NADH dehydrogenase [ubiquinone] 1 beta subcomplex subunit 9 n=1 Tax=Tegillarca granosa TaxID=220873 RepID=A0ABQ9EDR5_TEGGR|nr:hypothetical protein KUTeg_019849 [Tegillarca granosa]